MYVLVSMAGPIIESKDVRAMFQKKCKEILKKGKKGQKRAKYLKIWAKMYKVLKCSEKGQVIAIIAIIAPNKLYGRVRLLLVFSRSGKYVA